MPYDYGEILMVKVSGEKDNMIKKCLVKILIFSTLLLLAGCGKKSEDAVDIEKDDISMEAEREEGDSAEDIDESPDHEIESDDTTDEQPEPESVSVKYDPEELLDAFLANEIPAFSADEQYTMMWSDLDYEDEDWASYSVGERTDLDNDGEDEQIINGPYGGPYLDARDGKVYVLAEGEGTAGYLSYTHYDNAVWIVHSDTTHGGRQMYWLTKYDGDGNIADEFRLGAEYWDSPDDRYDENSKFTYRDEEISMTEYEALREEIIGY